MIPLTPRARLRAAAALAAAAWVAGCAPQRVMVPELTPAPRRARFEAALAARSARSVAEAGLNAWPSGTALPQLPGVQARLLLVGPDAFRLRVASLFGTALDMAARGDSFTAYVPPRRVALETGAARESLGISDPGGLGYRMWSATWRPPDAAWNDAIWEDSLLVLRWTEAEDSVRFAIGSTGLPRWIEMGRGREPGARAEYQSWARVEGVAWPAVLSVADPRGQYGLRCHVTSVQFRRSADRSRLAVEVPDQAAHITREQLKRAIARLGKL